VAAALALASAPRLAAQAADVGSRVGAFEVTTEHDPVLNADISSATTDDTQGGPMQLRFTCVYGQPSVSVTFGKWLAGNSADRVNVQYLYDGRPGPAAKYWDMETDHRSAHREGGDVLRLMETARHSQQLSMLVIDPLDSEMLLAVFSMDGLDAALQKITPCPAR
jgi:hypothetical protein